jgi:hypothetical protein
MTDVSRVIRYCRFHIYADDLMIYHTCAASDFQRGIDVLNLDMQRVHVHEWVDDLNGVEVGSANCYSKGPGFKSRVSHGPIQKVKH